MIIPRFPFNNSEFGKSPSTLIEILKWRGEHEPERTAYVFLVDGEKNEISLSYRELDQAARAIATLLQDQQAFGQRCLLIYPTGLEFIKAFFACLYAGVIAVPVYPPRKDKDIKRILLVAENSKARFLLTSTQTQLQFKKLQRKEGPSDLAKLNWLITDQIETKERVKLAEKWTDPNITEDHLAFLQYTSGSTGLPKGVMVSHRNLIYNQRMMESTFLHRKEWVVVSWLPLYHDMGLIGNILHPLYIGFKCVFMSPEVFLQRPIRWLEAITCFKASSSGGAPNFAYDLCSLRITPEQREKLDLSTWEFALVGADMVRQSTLERFIEIFAPCGFRREVFYPGYGLAEATLIASGGIKNAAPVYYSIQAEELKRNRVISASPGDKNASTLVGSGHTLLDQQIIIVNPQSLRKSKPDQVGEVWISGENVTKGYWENDKSTHSVFEAKLADTLEGPFLRTGDLGFLKDDELFITGRLKNIIIIRGQNHYPQDIELTVEQTVTAIRSGCCAAFSIDQNGEEHLVVMAELERRFMSDRRSGKNLKVQDQRKSGERRHFDIEDKGTAQSDIDIEIDECIQKIRHMILKNHGIQVHSIVLLRPVSLPKTTSGKIQHHECRKMYLTNKMLVQKKWTQAPFKASQTSSSTQSEQTFESIQTWLISRISDELKLPPQNIDPQAELYQYGLDSLIAISISGELEIFLKQSISPTIFYNYPSIQALSRHLSDSTDNQESSYNGGSKKEPGTEIAIIGVACRFPKALNPEAFWDLMLNGEDAIREVPAERWDAGSLYDPEPGTPDKMNTKWGGFIDDIDQFDPQFFGISKREAMSMDPQQRLLLEVSREVLENSGIATDKLAGSKTSVFIGISNNDYSRLILNQSAHINAYQGIGNALSIASNRISYQYDLKGPSIVIDTACSSSLVSVHMACQSLRQGESDLAIAGGVNLILSPEATLVFSQAGMMAGDGRCKTFDAAADGYVRSEGCGLVVLKLLSEALRDGDNIMSIIRGSAVNQDGRSNGITAPNGLSQQDVITSALNNAKVSPSDISYVEAHGTGTSLGDPIEMESLKAVLMKGRSSDQACLIGSVKTNLGHLESAAGIASLIKVTLSLHKNRIPGNLHFNKLNPHISIENTPFSIPTISQSWPEGRERQLAGISSFGFGGTNVHMVLEEYLKKWEAPFKKVSPTNVLTLSAKNQDALQSLAEKFKQHFLKIETSNENEMLFARSCFTANIGRTHFSNRLMIVSNSIEKVSEALSSFLKKEPCKELHSGCSGKISSSEIVFYFSGHESYYEKMGEQLYLTQGVFKESMDQCESILQTLMDQSLISLLYEKDISILSKDIYLQPALFALEYSLAILWRTWGIEPDRVIGKGVGEYVAACVAGVFDLKTALKLVVERGRLMERQEGIQNHFEAYASQFDYSPPKVPLICSLSGAPLAEGMVTEAKYWARQIGEDDQTTKGLNSLREENCKIFIEIGPAFTLQDFFDKNTTGTSIIQVPSLSEKITDWQQILDSLGSLYVNGINVDWHGFYSGNPHLRKVILPNSPFQRRKYWFEEKKTQLPDNNEPDRILYELEWKRRDKIGSDSKSSSFLGDQGFWGIFMDDSGIGGELVKLLGSYGKEAVLIYPGETFKDSGEGKFVINPEIETDFDLLVQAFSKMENSRCSGFIHLWSLNTKISQRITELSLHNAKILGCITILHLIQALNHHKKFTFSNLWLVTRQAQAVIRDSPDPVSIEQSPLWGLGKCIPLEHPELRVGLIDIGMEHLGEHASHIMTEISRRDQEYQVAYRNNHRFVARLTTGEEQTASPLKKFIWKKNATYIITGGLGKLGLMVANSIREQGARHIVLIGRSKSSEDLHLANNIPLQKLEQKGASIRIFQADVGNYHDMSRVFKEISLSMPHIRGIIHAAGIVRQDSIKEMTSDTFDSVLYAKVKGTWVLHQLSLSLKLDCFLMFSSISSLWGSKKIAHYAAANSFLDMISHYRRTLKLPALTLNWGPWTSGGMTTDAEQENLNRIGIHALDSDQALQKMTDILNTDSPQKIIARVDWDRLRTLYTSLGLGTNI